MKPVYLFGVVLLFLLCLCVDWAVGKFVKLGPCLFRWGEECPDTRINFYLFTKRNKGKGEKVEANVKSIQSSDFNPSLVNKVVIHGYNSDMNLTQLLQIKDAYLRTGNFNVWMVDWKEVAAGPCYPVVVSNLGYVGKCISDLIKNITALSMLDESKCVHLIGFSMGAHLAAYVANHMRPKKLPRITGLDPALPMFVTNNKDEKLDKTDALFVDGIHTDVFAEGHYERAGHVDFYMNGGVYQPGCWSANVFGTISCNHHRAPSYFAESISTTVGFFGWNCSSFWQYLADRCPYSYPTEIMGEYCSRRTKGVFVVHTASQPPFAIGHNKSAETILDHLMQRVMTFEKRYIFYDLTVTRQ